nr:MAG TPA: hypothetical protein [Caudoviricetes sp.]
MATVTVNIKKYSCGKWSKFRNYTLIFSIRGNYGIRRGS